MSMISQRPLERKEKVRLHKLRARHLPVTSSDMQSQL